MIVFHRMFQSKRCIVIAAVVFTFAGALLCIARNVRQTPVRGDTIVAQTNQGLEKALKSAPARSSSITARENKFAADVQSTTSASVSPQRDSDKTYYRVVNVVDGDTLDVSIDGVVERLRLIGIDTPETVDPRKPVQCFGKEASDRAKELLTGTRVFLESDPSQGERDKYDRLLRYVFFEDGTSFNQKMIREGYAHEYTYDTPYAYQEEFKKAEQDARESKAGLWGDRCNGDTSSETAVSLVSSKGCTIKGNISANKEKIYHMIGCGTYNKTVIDESKGERWFCSEQEAIEAGFRKALNCD